MVKIIKCITLWQPSTSWPAYLAGVLHGDGWCTPLTIGLRAKDGDFVEAFAHGLNLLFGLSVQPKRDNRGYWLIRAGNKSGRFSRIKSFQPSNNDDLSSWLRGLFDSEGNAQLWLNAAAGPGSYSRRVAIYSTDILTLERASEYLDWLEVPNMIRTTKNSDSHIGTKIVYELRMLRREGFAKFLDLVGSSIARKQSSLEKIVSTYQPDGWQARNWKKAVAARWPERSP